MGSVPVNFLINWIPSTQGWTCAHTIK